MAKTKKAAASETSTSTGTGKDAALHRVIAQIEKQYGQGSIMQMDENAYAKIEGVSTGALSLDIALGGAGIPRGRITELFGPESSGKTTLALHIIANAQKAGGIAAFIDAEHALDTTWAKRLGVDVSSMLVSQPDTGEQALDIAQMLIASNSVDVIVVDSVAALTPKAEIEGEMGDTHVGLQARLMSQAMRKLTAIIGRSRTALIFINQIRMKIGVMFGNPETTPGGKALKFYSSVRVDLRRITTLKDSKGAIGSRVRARIVKNKIAPPFRDTEFDIMFDSGISYEGDLLDMAAAEDIVQKSGAWLNYGDARLGQGRDNAKKYLAENPDLCREIRDKVLAAKGLAEP
ncbi:MAG: recombinase RecA [Sedimentisphaerales bacterium]|nr:recombinase RecA [Sedimentisphaerales bacterium]